MGNSYRKPLQRFLLGIWIAASGCQYFDYQLKLKKKKVLFICHSTEKLVLQKVGVTEKNLKNLAADGKFDGLRSYLPLQLTTSSQPLLVVACDFVHNRQVVSCKQH